MYMFTANSGRRRALSRRSAMSLLEITIAAALLTALMIVSTQLIRALGGNQQALERRALAMRTVQALAEQIGNTPWAALSSESVGLIEIPADVTSFLPNAKLNLALDEEHEPVVAKRVSLELQWNGSTGQPAGPARLTTWIFPDDLPLK
jgi:hypothetical protein